MLTQARDLFQVPPCVWKESTSLFQCWLQSCLQAVLSASFQANFKQIGAGAKRAKEAGVKLLQIRRCTEYLWGHDMGMCVALRIFALRLADVICASVPCAGHTQHRDTLVMDIDQSPKL